MTANTHKGRIIFSRQIFPNQLIQRTYVAVLVHFLWQGTALASNAMITKRPRLLSDRFVIGTSNTFKFRPCQSSKRNRGAQLEPRKGAR